MSLFLCFFIFFLVTFPSVLASLLDYSSIGVRGETRMAKHFEEWPCDVLKEIKRTWTFLQETQQSDTINIWLCKSCCMNSAIKRHVSSTLSWKRFLSLLNFCTPAFASTHSIWHVKAVFNQGGERERAVVVRQSVLPLRWKGFLFCLKYAGYF